ncbi:Pr6Pr family membrane protein [Flaviflagellibacter deserti]|uniref:Pr6Pr family membrane protein n=1 Tax=Flaviflagellibacter deserti TaxID=2267266 RepID=A0ABV9Z0M4_9HYPH
MRVFRGVAALVAIFGLVLQYGVLVATSPDLFLWMTFKFVSFFTILTNTLIALAFALPLFRPGTLFERPAVRMAVAAYAVVMVVIYAVILAPLEPPHEGANLVANTVLHRVTPALYLFDWLVSRGKGKLRWSDAWKLLIAPLIYGLYTLLHGPLSGFYPYPFFNVPKDGLGQVMLNLAGIVLFFYAVGLVLVAIGHAIAWRMAQIRPPS